MRILIVADPVRDLNPKSDSSFFLARAAIAEGYEVCWCSASDLAIFNSDVLVRSKKILKLPEKKFPSLGKALPAESVAHFDSVWIRKDPPFDSSYLTLCWMLSLMERKTLVVNPPSLLLKHHEKLLPLQAIESGFLTKMDILPTLVASAPVPSFPPEFPRGTVVAKPWLGFAGHSVRKFPDLKTAIRKNKAKDFSIYQPFMENIAEIGDRRVLFIDGEYAGDFVRLPQKGSFVANLAQGGRAVLRERSPAEVEICERIGKFLKSTGILFAGVDLLGKFVTEMNITSPTGLQTLVDLGGPNLAPKFFQMLKNNRGKARPS